MAGIALSPQDLPYRDKLREALVQDLYRRALVPVLLSLPILYVFYLILEDIIPQRPLIGWIFVGMIGVLIPRLASILFVDRIKARYPDPRVRVVVFATAACLLGLGIGAINIIAAPVVSPEQLALMAIIAAGINSIAIISMSPSLASYLLYMVPNIGSMGVAILIGPKLQYGGILLFLILSNLFALILMATYVHLAMRKAILLRLRVDDANTALQHANERLEAEIKERMEIAQSLKQRNDELEALNQKLANTHVQLLQSEKLASVGQLAAGVAHEINNPIAFVHSNLECLGNYVKDIVSVLDAYEEIEAASSNKDLARRKLERLKSSVDVNYLRDDIPVLMKESTDGLTRVEKIVKDLKEFAHLDQAEWQYIDLHQSLESTLNVAAHEIDAKAQVVREYGELPLVECLPAQINQVFLNVLINAAQAQVLRGTITLRTGRDGQFVWVQIIDTGKGIEPSHLGRIFDPFFTTKPVGVGPGLGLTVSYNIVQQHDGAIDVKSEVAKGSTFTIRLPIDAKKTQAQMHKLHTA
jgi:signal transduction histidine kinase